MQIRHIPMVHVMHCQGRGWQFSGNDEFYMHLRGNHAQIRPVGELYVRFHDGDEYVWSTVRISACLPCILACYDRLTCRRILSYLYPMA